MKTAPGFDAVVGTSHAVNTKVELRAPDDTVVGELPVTAGRVTGDATASVARWSGDITLAGLEWAPTGIDHPLSGLTGHYCSIQRSAAAYGQPEQWVEVARLWVYETSVAMSRSQAEMNVTLVSPARLLERAVHDDFTAHRNDPAQEMIARVLQVNLPYTATVLDTSTPVNIPQQYDPKDVTPLQVAEELSAVADVRVYFDALGRIVVRDALPALDVATLAPARQISVHLDVIEYDLLFGRGLFANDSVARFDWDDAQGQPQGTVGRATIAAGPGAKDGPAGRITIERQFDIDSTQGESDAYAASMLTAMKQAWVTSRIRAVQDPRIEPDDIVETEYLDRTLRHRVVGVSLDLRTDAMELTARTALPPAGGP